MNDSTIAKAKQTNAKLKEKPHIIQKQRRETHAGKETLSARTVELKLRMELARSEQQRLLEDLKSADASIAHQRNSLERAYSWNVLASDAYYIEQEIAASDSGTTTIATINGLRLAAPMFAKSWKEINSALGYVALLVSQLERMVPDDGGILQYKVHAAGSNSKIGSISATIQANLFFAEENFHFFSKRNFNNGLGQLLAHIKDLASILRQLDPTIVLPYEMDADAKTVAGVSLLWVDESTSSLDFTRSMKYLLTNLKHLDPMPALDSYQTNEHVCTLKLCTSNLKLLASKLTRLL